MLSEEQKKERVEYAKAHTVEKWAGRFGLSVASAKSFYSRCKISIRHGPRISDEELIELVKTHTAREIAEMYGLKPCCIFQRCVRLGIKSKRPGHRPGEKSKEILKYCETHSMSDAARKFDVSRQWVFQLIRRAKGATKQDSTTKSSRSFQLRHKKAGRPVHDSGL